MELRDLPLFEVRQRAAVRVHDFGRSADRKELVWALVPNASSHSGGGMVIPGCPRILDTASPYLLLDAVTGEPVAVLNDLELREGWARVRPERT